MNADAPATTRPDWRIERRREGLLKRLAGQLAERTEHDLAYLGDGDSETIAAKVEGLRSSLPQDGSWINPGVAEHLGQAELSWRRVSDARAFAAELTNRIEAMTYAQLCAERPENWRWP